MEMIKKYFPNLTEDQVSKFEKLAPLYEEWNQQINVISRKDMDQFYERHVLHSLAIAKVIRFNPGTKILDVGTGGGFPGIPLAILFPECEFHLVDSIGKKIKVVEAVVEALGLTNVRASHKRAEQLKDKYDFIVSRAVTKMPTFITWVRNKLQKKHKNALPNGILYLKGGDLTEEMSTLKTFHEYYEIPTYYEEEFFETKKIVYVQLY
ncbi:16S rRNA (guanine(527)-N(7))-methyltransferase RsmG [Brumimicrobium aurantiacum]|uniref:Ribosomal RNA small subunit methyltransferase G n=1 Tax=Brumimicrobium aurantiacum TaxID=1737063 RepID=A0A3E1EY91_9FLAO|nr:16S rRNA (guanine(527)-N(7))-methyltransferase RsmG [Brumimicrobium aurantiacum]RFC54516.1 16S rRNA (guanine(527)-N(7))-methyltransferase RsmG [Brumimicrobium aurantiacum]